MNINEFDFDLPEELIAQTPLKNRTESKLLVLDRETGDIADKKFYDIVDYLNPGDCLVLNDTKVLPARLFGVKEDTGAKIEILLLNPEESLYKVLIKPAKRVSVGTRVSFGDGQLIAEIVEKHDEGIHMVKLHHEGILEEILDQLGEMPLPPYIKERLEDKDRYQTVFARESGSAAAPTAGLHFTEALLETLKERGVEIHMVTLHVGLGTFRPVSVTDIETHEMHSEFYTMNEDTANALNAARKRGNKIISVGTTSTRTLETIYKKHGKFVADSGFTDIFIYPGIEVESIDGLITNFHLPKSSLVMLVSAFSTRENILNAYQHAIEEKYRFFSFGDAMFIIRT